MTQNSTISNKQDTYHFPVMESNVLELVDDYITTTGKNTIRMVDCGIGTGGHSFQLLEKYPTLNIFGIDLDQRMIEKLKRKQTHQNRLSLSHLNYKDLNTVSNSQAFPGIYHMKRRKERALKCDILLADLGYNMDQIDVLEGFSYSAQTPQVLDMRYDKNQGMSAKEVLNSFSAFELSEIFANYGNVEEAEYLSARIAKKRETAQIETTEDFKTILREFSSKQKMSNYKRNLKLCFQALRIFVNQELINLKLLLDNLEYLISRDSLVIFIGFHSLENQIIRKGLVELQHKFGQDNSEFWQIGKSPSKSEIKINPPSKSAKLFALRIDVRHKIIELKEKEKPANAMDLKHKIFKKLNK